SGELRLQASSSSASTAAARLIKAVTRCPRRSSSNPATAISAIAGCRDSTDVKSIKPYRICAPSRGYEPDRLRDDRGHALPTADGRIPKPVQIDDARFGIAERSIGLLVRLATVRAASIRGTNYS